MADDSSKAGCADGDASSVPARSGPRDPTNALPAEPIEGRLALMAPKAAAIGCLGITWWLDSYNRGLKGVHALAFPFFGRDATSRSQASYLVYNLISPVLIGTIEGSRRGFSTRTFALQSFVGLDLQVLGIGTTAPFYYLLSMAQWGSEYYAESDNIPLEVANAVLPATLLGYVLPAALISLVPLTATGVSRSGFNVQRCITYAFFAAPLTVPLLTTLVAKATRLLQRKLDRGSKVDKATPDARKPSKSHKSFAPQSSLITAYTFSFAIEAAQHIYTVTCRAIQTPIAQLSLTSVWSSLLTHPVVPRQRYSSVALYAGATLSFSLYTVWELRRRGMITNKETKRAAIGVMTGQVLFGSGATYAGLWWWREGVLSRIATPSSNET
ncbi:hypothetical protein diail_2911 [Diaporthe ilicicola]|nr:hypothetical protein diail_2911 [Diaporthe ilicicola]